MTVSYFVRVRMTQEYISVAIEKIAMVTEQVIAYEHSEKAENIHCHLMLIGCQVSTDTLKNYIKQSGPVPPRAGNKFWSFKTCTSDLDTPITYMSKGKLDPFYIKGFTPERIAELKDKWVTKTNLTQTKLQYIVKETPLEAKKRKNDLIQEMLSKIEHKGTEHIVRIIVQVLNDNKCIFGRYTIRDYYDTIMSRKFTENFINSMEYFVAYRV